MGAQQSSVAAKCAFYCMLSALAVQCREDFSDHKCKSYDDFLKRYKHILFNMGGLAPIVLLFGFENRRLGHGGDALQHLLGIPLVWLLWDGGATWFKRFEAPKTLALVVGHHIGAVIAYLYQPSLSSSQARANTLAFGSLWLCHSFGLLEKLLQMVFSHSRQKGQKTDIGSRMREMYAAMNVYFAHRLFYAPGQPGFGLNHQTIAMTVMLASRYLINDNHKNVDWLRRVEVPGMVSVYLSLLFRGRLAAGAALTAALYGAALVNAVLKPKSDTPSSWDPATASVQAVLAKWEDRFESLRTDEDRAAGLGALEEGFKNCPQKSTEAVKAFVAGRPEWQEKYPVIMAVAANDLKKLKELLASKADMNKKMEDWHDSTAIGWAAYLGRLSCALALIRAGVNPYDEGGAWETARKQGIKQLIQLEEEIAPVALAAAPPKSSLVLVKRGDARALRMLGLKAVCGPIECVRGGERLGIEPMHTDLRQAGPWTYDELGLGRPENCLKVEYDGEFLKTAAGMVFDVKMWQYKEGNDLCMVRGPNDEQTYLGNGGKGGRSFNVEDDGTVSPMLAPHLVLGISECASWNGLCYAQRVRRVLSSF